MHLLVTGASGLVGGNLLRAAAAAGHRVTGTVGRWAGPLPGLPQPVPVNLADPRAVEDLVRAARPDVIVNAAAISEPAQCEAEPALARQLNVVLPETLARLAAAAGARLVHLSTEQVFDGTAAPYRVGDARRAINRYAALKLEAEDRVDAAGGRSVVLRLPLLLGDSPGGRRSVHERLLMLWETGGAARLYEDEFRQVCTAASVAEALLEIVAHAELRGPLHWAGAAPVSRLELGQRVRARFGLAEAEAPILAVSRRDDPAAQASRQANLALDLAPLDRVLTVRPETLDQALARLAPPPWWRPART